MVGAVGAEGAIFLKSSLSLLLSYLSHAEALLNKHHGDTRELCWTLATQKEDTLLQREAQAHDCEEQGEGAGEAGAGAGAGLAADSEGRRNQTSQGAEQGAS